tara:strand:+ start:122 stop:586 length:465 start_codon:yes stop_codon:yes gene_type:complete
MGINVSHISSTGTLTLGTTSLGNTISADSIGSTGILTDHYLSDKEIKAKFSTTASHRRKFKVNEIFRHGVYILFMGNVVVYVGESINPYARVCSHIKSEKKFDGFKVIYCKESRRRYWEKKLIEGYLPKYNKTHKIRPIRRVANLNTGIGFAQR